MDTLLGCLILLGIFYLIADALYINGLAWIVYAVGGVVVAVAIRGLIESERLKQNANRLDRIAKKIDAACWWK
jgi:hypothetical protein